MKAAIHLCATPGASACNARSVFGKRLLTVRAVVALAVCGLTVALGAQPSLAGELAFEDTRCEQGPCEMSIWRATDDGLFAQRLTAMELQPVFGRDWSPSWSPDGDRVVFTRTTSYSEKPGGLFIADAAGRERVRQLTDGRSDLFPDWSPRGDTVVFESGREGAGGLPDRPSSVLRADSDVFLVNTDGSNVRRIVNGSGQDMKPRFSQDGTRVIYLAEGNGPGGLIGEADDSGWYSIALDGSDVRRLTFGLAPMPEYSPDGRYLAMITNWDEVYTMRADGTEIRRWPGESNHFASQVAWAPSGPTLFYNALDRSIRADVIYKVDLSSPEPTAVPLMTGGYPDWTDGSGALGPPDGIAPTTVLLGPQQRPLELPAANASASSEAKPRPRIPSVPAGKIHFFAVDRTGVGRVEAALGRVVGDRCRFLGTRRLGRLRSCRKPLYRPVNTDAQWRARAAKLGKGLSVIGFRTRDVKGNRTRAPRLTRVRLR